MRLRCTVLTLSDLTIGPKRVGSVLIPIFGVAGGFLFPGERLEPTQWVGAALVRAAIGVMPWRNVAKPIAIKTASVHQ